MARQVSWTSQGCMEESGCAVPFLLRRWTIDVRSIGEGRKYQASGQPVGLPQKVLKGQSIRELVERAGPVRLAARRVVPARCLKASLDMRNRLSRGRRRWRRHLRNVRLRFDEDSRAIRCNSERIPDRSPCRPKGSERQRQVARKAMLPQRGKVVMLPTSLSIKRRLPLYGDVPADRTCTPEGRAKEFGPLVHRSLEQALTSECA